MSSFKFLSVEIISELICFASSNGCCTHHDVSFNKSTDHHNRYYMYVSR